ncbi:MAG: acyltransferase [Leptospiraceae bacterium]|nr:acyltransferase [Leptospiraceae bacterium]
MSRTRTDLLRLISISFVLVIHVTGPYEVHFVKNHEFLSMDFFAVLLNQLARFSVPLFVALSGFGLTSKYIQQAKKRNPSASGLSIAPGPFYADRLSKIGLPFVFWSLLFLYFRDRLDGPYNAEFFQGLIPYLYKKGADYHFYFFHIIFECYAIFPALAWIMGRGKSYRRILLLLSALAQLYMSQPSHIVFADWPRPPFLFSAFILYWQFPLVLGMYIAFRDSSGAADQRPSTAILDVSKDKYGRVSEERSGEPVVGRSYLFLSGLLFLIALLEYIYWSYRSDTPGDFNHFTRISVMVYSTAVLLLFRFWPERDSNPERGSIISYLSGLTFFVFIVHTALLRGLQHYLPPWMPLTLVILWILSFGVAMLLDRIVGWPWLRLALALEKRRSDWPFGRK